MNAIHQLLRRMGRHATMLLPLSLLLGLAFQNIAALLRPIVWELAIALLTLALVRMDWPRLRSLLMRPWLALTLSLMNLIAVPLIVYFIWKSLGLWPGLVTALCLSAMCPGIISAATTANFLKLDSSLALVISVLTNFMVPFTMPALALWLLGLDLHLSALDLSLRLAKIMVISVVLAAIVRRLLGPKRLVEEASTLDGVSVIVLMIFAIPLMDGIVLRAQAEPLKLAGFVAGAFAGMIICNIVMAAITWPVLDKVTALTAGYCSGGRHNALLMAVLPATVDPDIFLFVAAVQFPIYLIPAMLQPIYRRLL